MLRLGVTGGIGSGKSTLAALLAKHHAGALLDADAISRASTAVGGCAIETIRKAFGDAAIGPDGALDRAFMRTHVFQQPLSRQKLEAIIHPLVRQEFQRQDLQAQQGGCMLAVYDIPLLVENAHWRALFDAVIVVDCSPQTQVERVRRRDSLSTERIESIMQAQAPRVLRLRGADAVVHNDTNKLEELVNGAHQLGTIWRLPQPQKASA